MADIDSAMRASAYSGRKNRGSRPDSEKTSTELEPFDPAAHAVKEKAEAISMWIMIALGVLVALLMRYYMMPTLEESQQVLWLLPVLIVATIPTIHRVIVPSSFSELYTKGNWFRASFLYLFTWLALSFALVNPPLADIAAPHLAGAIDIEVVEGISDSSLRGNTYDLQIDQEKVPIVMGLAVRDNVDAQNSTISLTISRKGQVEPIVDVSGTVQEIAETGSSEKFYSVENWQRGMLKNTLTDEQLGPKVAPNPSDIGMAWDICELSGCGPGEYTISLQMSEEGAPWKSGQNSWSTEYKILISQVA